MDRHVLLRFATDDLIAAKRYFEEFGYVVVRDAFPADLGRAFWEDVERQIAHNEKLTFSVYGKLYQGSQAPLEGKRLPRIIDIESHSATARELLLCPSVARFLEQLYGTLPTCLQTLTYKYSSEQGAHSDKTLVTPPCAHDYARESLAAAWFALEAADDRNGALVIYPGSHKLPKRGFFDGFGEDYGAYTRWLYEWLDNNGFIAMNYEARPGEVLFWHGDFVHAGGKILSPQDPPPTRKSLVCHYARIEAARPSLDPNWVRLRLKGGSYFHKASCEPPGILRRLLRSTR